MAEAILRRPTLQAKVCWAGRTVAIGGGAPVAVQSMTNTPTDDVEASAAQAADLARAGSELVRLTVNTPAAARAIPRIREKLDAMGLDVPLVGDFHYNGHKLLGDYPECAQALSKYRINPGNVGSGARHENNFAAMVEAALRWDKPIRIGVNWGSLDQELLARMMDANRASVTPETNAAVLRHALVESAVSSARAAEKLGMDPAQIVLSAKVSGVPELVAVYRELAGRGPWPLHLGLTEAGIGSKGIVATTAALSLLLAEGIGDTIRVSLTPEPGQARSNEVVVAQEILQSLGLRRFCPQVTSCPGCGRTSGTLFQSLAQATQAYLRSRAQDWRERFPGSESMTVAVMGCVVNGPGESRHASIGISLPGSGENPVAPVYADGVKIASLKGEDLAGQFCEVIASYVEKTYGGTRKASGQS